MRPTFLMVLIGILSVLPIIILGTRHSDKILFKNTYDRGLQYDKIMEKRRDLALSLNEIDCAEDRCILYIKYDNTLPNDIIVSIFSPSEGKDSVITSTEFGNPLKVTFEKDRVGWHMFRVEYLDKGILINIDKSFYIGG